MNNEFKHIPLSSMFDYVDGNLTSIERDKVQEHLQQCQLCEKMLDIMRNIHVNTLNSSLQNQPDALVNLAVKAAMRESSRVTEPVRKYLSKVADSHSLQGNQGVRGTFQERQLLYSDNALMVSIQIDYADEEPILYTFRGQIIPSEPLNLELAGILVELKRGSVSIRQCISDGTGRFRMSGLVGGKYQLYIEQQSHDTVLDDIET